MHRVFVLGVLLAAAAALSAVAPSGISGERIGEGDPIFEREVLSYHIEERGEETMVAYQYRAEALPPLLDPREVVPLRTESSYTRYLGENGNGEPIYQLVAYSDKTFVEEGDKWYARETGRTDYATFAAARDAQPLAALFWKIAHADSISPFSSAGDGFITGDGVEASEACDPGATSWTSAQTATSGSDSDTDIALNVSAATLVDTEFDPDQCSASISRAFVPFVTSAIPGSGTISAATLNLYVVSKSNDDNDGTDYLTVVQTSQVTHTVLAAGDYDQCGSVAAPTEGIDSGERKDLTSLSTSAYVVFTLNSTGRGWVKKSGEASNCTATTGVTCLGVREGHDTTNSPVGNNLTNSASISTSEETLTAQDPYLSVTYTVPGGGRQMRLLGGVRLRGVRLLGL
jgi:hypothetical protein